MWNGHRYRWLDGDWTIVDDGTYPYLPGNAAVARPAPDDLSRDAPAQTVPSAQTSSSADAPTVAAVEAALAALNYYDGPIDGLANDQIRAAIANYRRDHRLTAAGGIDPALLDALRLR